MLRPGMLRQISVVLSLATFALVAACDVGESSSSNAAGSAGRAISAGGAMPGAQGGAPSIAGNPSDGGASNASGASGAGASERTPISAKLAVAGMGKGFNLGQMFESTQHPPTFAAASAKIDAYYEKGFRLLRLPVTWTEATNGDTLVFDPAVGDVNRSHPRLQVIAQVVDYALSKPGLYVVIDAHHETTLKTQSRAAVLERLWSDIAQIFAERGYRLAFEILNEPHREDDTAMPAAELRAMTAKAYAKIRAVDPARLVVIGGNQWFAAAEVPAVWTDLSGVGNGDDPYLMATFHHYNPWTFCGDHQGTYDDAWTDADIAQPMATMSVWASSVGKAMPVFIGEWGVAWQSRYEQFSCNNIRQWYQKFAHEFAEPRGIPTAVWDDGGWFKIYDHTSNAFSNNLVDCISGACDWDGSERFNAGCQ